MLNFLSVGVGGKKYSKRGLKKAQSKSGNQNKNKYQIYKWDNKPSGQKYILMHF